MKGLCPKCGQEHDPRRCIGHSQGRPCKLFPVKGAKVCHKHGGRAPQVKAAAKRRLQAKSAERAVITFGLPRQIDPHSALLEELHRVAGVVAWLSDEIARLDADEITQFDMTGRFEKPSVLVEMYGDERDRFTRVAKAAIDAGIEERRVKLAEAQGEQLGQVIRNVLADVFGLLAAAGIAADLLRRLQRDDVPTVVRGRLMEMAELGP